MTQKWGARLRARREELGLTLQQVASQIGITPSAVQRIENGLNKGSVDTLINMCRVLKVSADELFGLGGNEMPMSSGDDQARRLMVLFRSLPEAERRELMRAARQLAADAPASLDA